MYTYLSKDIDNCLSMTFSSHCNGQKLEGFDERRGEREAKCIRKFAKITETVQILLAFSCDGVLVSWN